MSYSGDAIPAAGGVYLLLCDAPSGVVVQTAGGRQFDLGAGRYVYVGSARGPGGLAARLGRHLGQTKRTHWHIDYLLHLATPAGYVCLDGTLRECELVALIGQLAGSAVISGFGASDCRCPGHLVRLVTPLSAGALTHGLAARAAAAGVTLPVIAVADRLAL